MLLFSPVFLGFDSAFSTVNARGAKDDQSKKITAEANRANHKFMIYSEGEHVMYVWRTGGEARPYLRGAMAYSRFLTS